MPQSDPCSPPSHWLKAAPEGVKPPPPILVTCFFLLLCWSGLLRPEHPSGKELKMLVVGMGLASKGMVSASGESLIASVINI